MEWLIENRSKLLVSLAFLFSLLALFYYFFLLPLEHEKSEFEQLITAEERQIAALRSEIERGGATDANLTQLERQMPLDREVDGYLLSLSEVETVSNSRIESISFNQYDGALDESVVNYRNEEREQEQAEAGEEPGPELTPPEGVYVLGLSLQVVSPDYDHFLSFLEELETRERLTSILQVNFTQPNEQQLLFAENPSEVIAFSVNIETYYYPNQ
ncbi:hypothetical protein [Desertibacillus haloalkaliphilus]|uniref:hypothetical protein n=1 Tax=Desertibacillus haloalkaliphilus TaxID=1328930 RepID=UPI001C25738D|nr:hypothetical protein [Desertibacillus haloalkaliphilus]MBU8905044.1 hypothetical protein [Desertibacillus haloalkaliphilus]